MKKYSKKGLEKRKAERECLPEFFIHHVEKIKTERLCCEECGDKLRGDVSEVAHVLPKQYFKSVMCSDLNVLYLCGLYSDNECHLKFDNLSQEKIKQMKIYPKVQEIFKNLIPIIAERISYKHNERFE